MRRSDIRHYYSVEEEAPMTFSPDASFPVINIEKGSLHGQFTAEFEKSQALPRMVSFKSGTKSNVVPSKARPYLRDWTAPIQRHLPTL